MWSYLVDVLQSNLPATGDGFDAVRQSSSRSRTTHNLQSPSFSTGQLAQNICQCDSYQGWSVNVIIDFFTRSMWSFVLSSSDAAWQDVMWVPK